MHSQKCQGKEHCTCDGYHTFEELSYYRIASYIDLVVKHESWRSKRHSDGELVFGGDWFVLGIGKGNGEKITCYLPMSRWEDTEFAETLEKAP